MFFNASSATATRPVAMRYSADFLSKGKIEVVAPTSAPILQIVPFPVAESDSVPSPKYSITAFVPPFTVRIPASFRITSFGEAQPESFPVSLTPMIFGILSSHGNPAITSTASAPPTPMAIMPSPPALGVCESVPIIIPPGKA